MERYTLLQAGVARVTWNCWDEGAEIIRTVPSCQNSPGAGLASSRPIGIPFEAPGRSLGVSFEDKWFVAAISPATRD